jgi:Zn-dependent oligopeptidase
MTRCIDPGKKLPVGNFKLASVLLCSIAFTPAILAAEINEAAAVTEIETAKQATKPVGTLHFIDTVASVKSLASFQPAASKAKVLFDVPVWEKTPAEIEASADAAIAEADKQLDAIAARTVESSDFSNTIAALDDAFYPVINVSDRIDVIRESSQDKAMRDKALEVSKKIQAWYVAAGFREDVYKAVAAYAETKPELEGEDALLLKETLRDYRRNGMALPKEKRDQLKALKTELNNMGLEFATNITDAKVVAEFSAGELAGLPEDFLNNKELKTEQGTYKVKANVTWQYLAVMQDASNEVTRKKLVTLRSNRAKEKNIPLFTKMLKTRAQIAELLGYDNWADYRIETKMAKNACWVMTIGRIIESRQKWRRMPKQLLILSKDWWTVCNPSSRRKWLYCKS